MEKVGKQSRFSFATSTTKSGPTLPGSRKTGLNPLRHTGKPAKPGNLRSRQADVWNIHVLAQAHVRAGSNTLAPYDENPPDLTIGADDIVFLDLGPVFEEWEADFGRTFVLGSDPVKLKLRDDIGKAFIEGKEYFKTHPDITADELYRHAQKLARDFGWEFGGPIAGHLIGQFPHERILGDKVTLYVHPDNPNRMRGLDAEGQERHWIFEVHFVDRARQIGGFYEELLTIG